MWGFLLAAVICLPTFLFVRLKHKWLSNRECAFGMVCCLIWIVGMFLPLPNILKDVVFLSLLGMYLMVFRVLSRGKMAQYIRARRNQNL